MKRTITIIAAIAVIALAGWGVMNVEKVKGVLNQSQSFDRATSTATSTAEQKAEAIDPELIEIMNEEEFKQRSIEEAMIIKARRDLDAAIKALEELEGKGFSSDRDKAAAVREYLQAAGSDLHVYADSIIQMERWPEILAIVSQETSFCRAGVGASRNNCGAIKNSATGEFKRYASKLHALEDMEILLQKPLYKDKTIAQMNGTYCVYEEGPTGTGPCPNWTEHIEGVVQEIKMLALVR